MANQLTLAGGNQAPNPFGYQPITPSEMYGPFTSALAPEQPQQAQPQPSGYGGAKEALSMFAAKFLQGAQAARRQAFEKSEQQKMEHAQNFDSVLQHIQNGPYTAEAKQQAFDAWAKIRYGDIQNQMAGGGKGKGGGGKAGKQDHQNPLLHFAHGVVSSVLGPVQNEKHPDFGPEAVNQLLSIANNPANQINIPKMTEEATGALSTAIQGAQETAQKAGVTLDRGTLLAMPSVQKALNPFTANNMDWRQIPQLASLVEGVPAKLSPLEEAQLAREKQLTETGKAQETEAQTRTRQATEGIPQPYTASWRDQNGQLQTRTVNRNDVTGKITDAEGRPVTDLPAQATLTPAAASYLSAQVNADTADKRMQTQRDIAAMQVKSRELLSRFTQGKLDERFYAGVDMKGDVQVLSDYNKLLDRRGQIAKGQTKNAADRKRVEDSLKLIDDQIKQLKPGADAAFQRLQTADTTGTDEPPGEKPKATPKPTAAPPAKKEPQKATGLLGTGHENVDSLIQDLFKPAGATGAPPQ